jgi:thioredoxin reductase (NADPH)
MPLIPAPIETDALIIGAGPAGLFQVFELGLLDIKAHVVDALPHAGGQCAELYPHKPIYDIPGIPVCTGLELTERLLQQIAPFGATFHWGQEVSALEQQSDGLFAVETSAGTRFLCKTVFIAAGVGAFQPRKLPLDGLQAFEGSQLFYRADPSTNFQNKRVVIVGGDEVAIAHALQLCAAHGDNFPHKAQHVTLVHRRDVFQAPDTLVGLMRDYCAAGAMDLVIGQIQTWGTHDGKMTMLHVATPDGSTQALPVDQLLVCLGLTPKLGPVATWGLDMERKQLRVDTEKFSTSTPGIFAVGDINTYPGKKKLIVCSFHECTLAAYAAAAIIFPGKTIHLQYTTTSTALHKTLGVEAAFSQ